MTVSPFQVQHFLLFLFRNCNIFYYIPFCGEKL